MSSLSSSNAVKTRRTRRAMSIAAMVTVALPLGTAHATFPGENGVVVYAAPDGMYKIVAIPGSVPVKIVNAGANVPLHPAVSPNGKKLAYVLGWDIIVANIDGSGPINLTKGVAPNASPAWSPDGTRLAFVRHDGIGQSEHGLYTMNIDGSGLRRVADAESEARKPSVSWSPLGDRIAYAPAVTSSFSEVWLTAVDGSVKERVAWGDNAFWSLPSWAPEAGSIVVLRSDFTSQKIYEFTLSPPLGHAIPLTGALTPWSIAVSPDGTRMATWIGDPGATGIVTLPRAGGQSERLVSQSFAAFISALDWARVPKAGMSRSFANGVWQPAVPLANDPDFYSEQIAVAVMPDGGTRGQYIEQVLAVGPDGRVYHRALRLDPFGQEFWTPYSLVPGLGGDPKGIRAKKVAIAGAADGSAQCVIVGADNLLYHAMRYADGSWSDGVHNGFGQLDGYAGAGSFAARDVAIAIVGSSATTPGIAHVVANGLDVGALYHRVRYVDRNWSPFGQVPGSAGGNTGEVSIAAAPNGDAYMAVTVSNGTSTQIQRQVRWGSNGSWDNFVVVGSVPVKVTDVSLAITADASNPRALLAFVDSNGGTWVQDRGNLTQAASWSSAVNNTSLMSTGSRTVSISTPPVASMNTEVLMVQAQPQ